MEWSEVSLAPSSRTLRQFAGVWLLFFGSLGFWHGLVRAQQFLGLVLLTLALTIGPVGLLRPQAIRVIFAACTIVTFPIGWLASRLVLALLFYVVITPVAVFFKMTGRDALQRKRHADQETYWAAKPQARDLRSYLRQF